jgi:hypothetical protein
MCHCFGQSTLECSADHYEKVYFYIISQDFDTEFEVNATIQDSTRASKELTSRNS